MTITEFLEARIAEDEDLARKADSGRWLPEDKGVTFEFYGDEFPVGEAQTRMVADTRANQNHIAQWDPARVLAECAAKRAIIKAFDPQCPDLDPYVGRDVIAMLATVYKDHPEYQQEWASK